MEVSDQDSPSPVGVTIIVCCYNSTGVLEPTLAHLARQYHESHLALELIVIDNASDDGTASFAESVWEQQQSPFPLRVVHEPKPGLSHARRCGLAAAKHDYVIYCDDDNWLCEDYAARVATIFSGNPEIGGCGGWGSAVTDGPLPEWFPIFEKSFATGPQAGQAGKVDFLYGAGLGLRKELVERVHASGYQSLLSDRKGKELSSGGDNELCQWIRLLGYQLYYDPGLRFQHFLHPSRLNRSYLKGLFRAFGHGQAVLKAYRIALAKKPNPLLRSTFVQIIRSLAAMFAQFVFPPRPRAHWLYLTRNLEQTKWLIKNPGQLAKNIDHINRVFSKLRSRT